MKKQLLIFTRYPEPGKTKTRLVPALGNAGAAQIHRQMAEQTVTMADSFAKDYDCALTIYYQGGSLQSMIDWLGHHSYQEQYPGDIGQRLDKGFKKTFLRQKTSVIAIGTDCPDLRPELLTKAFAALDKSDVVLGPAFDGGYYLIGLNKLHSALFTDIDWGTKSVLSQTLLKADHNNLTSSLLEPLHDIDRPEDIKHLSYHSLPE